MFLCKAEVNVRTETCIFGLCNALSIVGARGGASNGNEYHDYFLVCEGGQQIWVRFLEETFTWVSGPTQTLSCPATAGDCSPQEKRAGR